MTYLALNCLNPLKYIESYLRKSKVIFKFLAIFVKIGFLIFLALGKPLQYSHLLIQKITKNRNLRKSILRLVKNSIFVFFSYTLKSLKILKSLILS